MNRILANGTVLALAGMLYAFSGMATVAMSDGGGSGDSGGTSPTSASPKCPKGQVWDPNAARLFGKGKCVSEAEFGGNATEKQSLFYNYGKSRADAGDYADAIVVLKMAPDQTDPRVLNYLGFSHRKLGRMDEALGYYRAAIAQNPDFTLVREYLGEAFIQLGLLEKAREQLSQIERICGGRECGEYRKLADLMVDSQIAE
jgi:tetratricopeptide (TPR) repeat protein